MIRETISNTLIATGRTIGRTSGLELCVELSDHSINARMEQPDESKRAWDPSLYKHGNVFVAGYANPVKPRVQYNDELENPNELEVREGEPDEEPPADGDDATDGDDEPDDGPHVQLISSGRYREYMRQDLISQLLTPESRWHMLMYGVIGLGVLGFLQIIVTLYATGSFA